MYHVKVEIVGQLEIIALVTFGSEKAYLSTTSRPIMPLVLGEERDKGESLFYVSKISMWSLNYEKVM